MKRAVVGGEVNLALVRELQRARRPLEYPTGTAGDREAILRRATIQRLERQGIVQRDREAGTFELVPGLEIRFRKPLLERLREGPLRSSDWREVASSRTALRTHVSQLKRRGYDIVAVPDPDACEIVGGKRAVRYELQSLAK